MKKALIAFSLVVSMMLMAVPSFAAVNRCADEQHNRIVHHDALENGITVVDSSYLEYAKQNGEICTEDSDEYKQLEQLLNRGMIMPFGASCSPSGGHELGRWEDVSHIPGSALGFTDRCFFSTIITYACYYCPYRYSQPTGELYYTLNCHYCNRWG